MNLKVFYHVIDFPDWKDITDEQLSDMKVSGLLDIAEVYINCNYNESSFDSLREEWKDYSNIKWIFQNNLKEDFEHPTFILMKNIADESEDDFFALYLHLKGITRIGTSTETPTKHWRWLMNYFNITKWRDCVEKLEEGYDAVGCIMQPKRAIPQHFSGNIYWVKSNFLKKCMQLPLPSSTNFLTYVPGNILSYRNDVELWCGYNNANLYCIFNVDHDFYNNEFPPHLYR